MAPWARLRRTWCVRRAVPPRERTADGAPGASRADRIALAQLTWTRGTERGQVVWTCDACSRAHLRSIEAKLDPAWW